MEKAVHVFSGELSWLYVLGRYSTTTNQRQTNRASEEEGA